MTANVPDLAHPHPTAVEARLAQLRRQYLVLSASNRTLIHSDNEHELLTEICRALVDIGGYRLAWVGFSGARGGAAAESIVSAAWSRGAIDPSQLRWAHALDG